MNHFLRALSILGVVLITTFRAISMVAAWCWRWTVRAFTDELPQPEVNDVWFDSHIQMDQEIREFEDHRRQMARPMWVGAVATVVGVLVGIAWVQSAPGIGEPHPDSIVDTGSTSISVESPSVFAGLGIE